MRNALLTNSLSFPSPNKDPFHFRDHPPQPPCPFPSFHLPLHFPLPYFTILTSLSLSLSLCSIPKLLSFAFMAEEDSGPGSPHSLKHKLRSSLCLSCCFPHLLHHRVKPSIVRSASLHNKSRSASDFPHLKDKCCNFIARICRHHNHHHHRRHSADFHYDALSYALNFEDDASDDRSGEDLRSFSARLPQSPPPEESPPAPAKAATATVEVTALS